MTQYNFIINSDEAVSTWSDETNMASLADAASLPTAEHYVVNWSSTGMDDIYIDSIEIDDEVVWEGNEIDMEDWTGADEDLSEALMAHVENVVLNDPYGMHDV